jgi:uncharacterized protein YecT (DUF1311 family)
MQPASRMSVFRRKSILVGTAFCLLQATASLVAQPASDEQLNKTYQEVLAKLTPAGRQQLRKAERAWLAFLELDRAAMRAAAARLHLTSEHEQSFEREVIDARISQLEELSDSTASEPEPAAVFRRNDAQLNVIYQRCLTSMTPPEIDALR